MRVFVTGAAGFVGRRVVKELTGAGHRVLGLARAKDVGALATMEAEGHPGALEELDSLRTVASLAEDEAQAHFGALSLFIGQDMPASGVATQEKLGWRPTGPGLIDDLDEIDDSNPRPAG